MVQNESKVARAVADRVKSCGSPVYRVARKAGIDAASLYRFSQGKGGLGTGNLERVADALDCEIVLVPKRREA